LLINEGSIRIGTLHDFRRTEHRQGIGDPDEGRKTLTGEIPPGKLIGDAGDPREELLETVGWKVRHGSAFVFGEGNRVITTFDVNDCFILCFSTACRYRVMRSFHGADTCVRITRCERFLELVTSRLHAKCPVKFRGVFDVEYKAVRDEVWNGRNLGRSPGMMKTDNFAIQREVRAIWSPLDEAQTLTPLIVADRRLVEHCSVVFTHEHGQ
jgi:hypothetical protein